MAVEKAEDLVGRRCGADKVGEQLGNCNADEARLVVGSERSDLVDERIRPQRIARSCIGDNTACAASGMSSRRGRPRRGLWSTISPVFTRGRGDRASSARLIVSLRLGVP